MWLFFWKRVFGRKKKERVLWISRYCDSTGVTFGVTFFFAEDTGYDFVREITKKKKKKCWEFDWNVEQLTFGVTFFSLRNMLCFRSWEKKKNGFCQRRKRRERWGRFSWVEITKYSFVGIKQDKMDLFEMFRKFGWTRHRQSITRAFIFP